MLSDNEITLHSGAWYGDSDLSFKFPENWKISLYHPRDAEPVDELTIERAFSNPIGTKRISKLASGKQSAAIIVDDLSRPTPADKVIPYIIRELNEAGIENESIRFVIGGGAHRPLTKRETGKKIGADIVAKYEVYNHDSYSGNLQGLGNLEDGTPIYINDVVANSEFRMGVGGIVPHGGAGLGGGAKLIVPGVAGIATIAYNHVLYKGRGRGNINRQQEERDMRDNAEDVARHLGLDVIVNIVLNSRREVAGLYVGDVVEVYKEGAKFAKGVYETIIPAEEAENTDIVVINTYPQDSDPVQIGKSLWALGLFKNAYKVVIDPASDGILYHGLHADRMDYKRFLRTKANQSQSNIPKEVGIKSKEDLILLTENFPPNDFYRAHPNGALFKDWEDIIEGFKGIYSSKANVNVAVLPCSPIQLPSTEK